PPPTPPPGPARAAPHQVPRAGARRERRAVVAFRRRTIRTSQRCVGCVKSVRPANQVKEDWIDVEGDDLAGAAPGAARDPLPPDDPPAHAPPSSSQLLSAPPL